MNSFYDVVSKAEIICRIGKLTPNSNAVWGKMSADQMCKHCSLVLDSALGKLNYKPNLPLRIIGRIIKNKVVYGEVMAKEKPTHKNLVITKNYNLEEVKLELLERVNNFSIEGKNATKNRKHPFFGNLTCEEWDLLMWKHLDHHLTQFGV
ncbi:MAG: DUF1569 domain-containing protein [Fusobacteriaceae bacterium]